MDSSHLRLWQLISPTLPVGAYAYSQAMEYANHVGWVNDEITTFDWLSGQMHNTIGCLDLPILLRLMDCAASNNITKAQYWNEFLLSSRESNELLQEDKQIGRALARLLTDLENALPSELQSGDVAFATGFAFVSASWQIEQKQAAQGYLWTWIENQIAAAIKLIPLGQTAGQRLLLRLSDEIPKIINKANKLTDEEIGGTAYGVAIASAMHETQYTRLFRS